MRKARRLQELADRMAALQGDLDTLAGSLRADEMHACAAALSCLRDSLSEPERQTRTIVAQMNRAEALEFFGGRW